MILCCGFFKLRTAGIVIGVLQVIGAIYGILIASNAIANISSQIEKLNGRLIDEALKEKLHYEFQTLLVIMYIGVCLCIIHIFIASFLIIGITKRIASSLTVWIGYNCLSIIITIIMWFILIMHFGVTHHHGAMFLGVLIHLNNISVMVRLQKQMKENQEKDDEVTLTVTV